MGEELIVLVADRDADLEIGRDVPRRQGDQDRGVVAAGGDGTVSAVASLLVGTDRVLGVLPLGTWNHFARDLGIPADLEGAVRVIREGAPRAVDVGEVNGRIFLNNSSIGLYPAIVRQREKQQERLGRSKWSALFWATIRVLRHHHSVTVRLDAEGEARVLRTPLLFIGNNAYDMRGFEIGQRSRLDGGELSLYLTKRSSVWALIRLALRALFGSLHEGEDFEELRVRGHEVTLRGALPWSDPGHALVSREVVEIHDDRTAWSFHHIQAVQAQPEGPPAPLRDGAQVGIDLAESRLRAA